MTRALTAGIIIAGIMAISGTSFAAHSRPPEPPRDFDGKHPPISRDIRSERNRPPLPPDKKHPRVSYDRRPPEFDRNRVPLQQGVEPR